MEPSGVGIYILDACADVINAADVIKKFLELDCKACNQQLEQKVPISQSITKIVLQMQQSEMCTHLTHDYFKERSKTVDLFLISDGDLLSISKLKQNKNHDVIIIIGHSSVSNIGRLQTSDVLNIFIQSPQPSIIAILGCCGGNNRYGPLFKLSHWKHKTIYGFYQRMVSTDELNESSLILGIRNYLCLSKYSVYIPESCEKLATYHIYVEDSEGIKQFLKEFTKTEFSNIQEIDKKCKHECERLNLHKIIPRVINVIKKSLGGIRIIQEKTIDYLRNGEWNKVSDMQLFAAISQGYWGKNSYKAIMDFANSRLCNMRNQYRFSSDYELCAIIFCLLCEDSYLSVDSTGFLDVYCQRSFSELQLENLDDQMYLPAKKKKLKMQLQVSYSRFDKFRYPQLG